VSSNRAPSRAGNADRESISAYLVVARDRALATRAGARTSARTLAKTGQLKKHGKRAARSGAPAQRYGGAHRRAVERYHARCAL